MKICKLPIACVRFYKSGQAEPLNIKFYGPTPTGALGYWDSYLNDLLFKIENLKFPIDVFMIMPPFSCSSVTSFNFPSIRGHKTTLLG